MSSFVGSLNVLKIWNCTKYMHACAFDLFQALIMIASQNDSKPNSKYYCPNYERCYRHHLGELEIHTVFMQQYSTFKVWPGLQPTSFYVSFAEKALDTLALDNKDYLSSPIN